MKLIHTADLHIGKQVCGHSMLEDQRFILSQILMVIDEEMPDGLLLAGDIYDKTVPSAEAVSLLDDFLVELSKRKVDVFVLSGNHDSAERIAFGGRLMGFSGVHVSPVYDGKFAPVTLKGDAGEVDVWMLPFVRPATVRAFLDTDEERNQVTDHTSAIRMAVSKMDRRTDRKNVLLAHLFVTGAARSDSEENIGGLDNVDVSVFQDFDYVALGHIHKPQNLALNGQGVPQVRYSGTPLKYSLSESTHAKSLTVVEFTPELSVREIPLKPLRDLRQIRGTFAEVVSAAFKAGQNLDDYVYVQLTDENDVPDAAAKIRSNYPHLMMVDYDNSRTRNMAVLQQVEDAERKSPETLFGDFFKEMNGREMNLEESDFVKSLISSIWKGDE